jgi:enterochelin esterase-like enzyme
MVSETESLLRTSYCPRLSPVASQFHLKSEVALESALPGEDEALPAERTPHRRLKLHSQFHSRFLPNDRDVMVYLPPEYGDEPERRFPVLYMHDGQNLFDPRKSFVPGRTWQVRETADGMILAQDVEPLIIVGIHNTGERRLAEYTFCRDWKLGGGEAAKYGRLIVEELMPFIDSEYRTLGGAEHTGMAGSSLGGLVTLYLGLKYAERFGRLAVLSPSVWWANRAILEYVRDRRPERGRVPRIWLDVGTAEGARTVTDANALHRRLVAEGWRDEVDLHYERIDGGTHDEAAWAARMAPILRFLFPAGRRG